MMLNKSHKKIQIEGSYRLHLFPSIDMLSAKESELWYRMNLILTKVYQKGFAYQYRATEGQLAKDGVYVYFNRSESRHLGGVKYAEVFKALEDAGLLISKDYKNYKNGNQKIRTYEPITEKPYKYFAVIRHSRIQTSLDSYYTEKIKGYSPVVRDKVIPSLRKIKIHITEDQFWTAVDNNYENYRRQRVYKNKLPLPIEKYRTEYEPLWAEIQAWNSVTGNEFFQYITEDKFSGRVHTTITTLPKFIREMGVLRYNDEPLAELDIKTFQPLLLAIILDGTDFSRWFFSVNDCYTEIQKMFDLPTRDTAKQYMYKWMFGTSYGKYHKQFCEMFPEAGVSLTRIKQKYNPENINSFKVGRAGRKVRNFHSNAAYLMQSKEVSVMRQVWAAVNKRQISFATIHDAILVPESRIDEAYGIMSAILGSHLKPAAGRFSVRKKLYLRLGAAA